MREEIKVTVFKRAGRKHFELQWVDPVTGKKRTKSTGCDKKREADRFAGRFLVELKERNYRPAQKISWADFRELYEDEKQWADTSLKIWFCVANHIEQIIGPSKLCSIGRDQVALFVSRLSGQTAQSTIGNYLRYLQSALNWAKRRGLLESVPQFERLRTNEGAKGRPIATEEFERVLDQIPKRRMYPDEWDFFLRGLWWSGLRLGEAMNLSWDDPRKLFVDLSGKYPMIQIPAGYQKNRTAELYPLAPEFAEMMLSVPEGRRSGPVFNPLANLQVEQRVSLKIVSLAVSQMSEAAGVRVSEPGIKTKWATPHDFRRSFGSRWAKRVMPAVLMRLMRHRTMVVTMKYYATRDAESVAETAYAALANSFANIEPKKCVFPAKNG